MTDFIVSCKRLIRSEDAPTMVEYGLIVALIAIVVAAAAVTLATSVKDLFTAASHSV